MTDRIWIVDLTAEQLMVWLAPPRTEARFAILERIDAIDFPAPDEEIAPERWSRGRIFGASFELRWERRGETYHTRFTGEREVGPPFTIWPMPVDTEMCDAGCYLWGRAEMRIGRQLEYRAAPKGEGRLRLTRREFRQQSNSALIAERLTGMEWEAENESL